MFIIRIILLKINRHLSFFETLIEKCLASFLRKGSENCLLSKLPHHPRHVTRVLEVQVNADIFIRRVGAGVGVAKSRRGDRESQIVNEGIVHAELALTEFAVQ